MFSPQLEQNLSLLVLPLSASDFAICETSKTLSIIQNQIGHLKEFRSKIFHLDALDPLLPNPGSLIHFLQ